MQQVLLENHFAATCQTKAVHAIKQKWRPTTRTKIIIFYWIYFKWNSQRWSECEPEDQSYFSQVQVINTGSKVNINIYRNKQSEKSLVNTGVKLTSYSGEFKTCNSKMCTSILWSSGKETYVTTEDQRSVVGYTRIQILLLIRIHWSNYINNKIRAFFFYMYWWMFEYVFWPFVF